MRLDGKRCIVTGGASGFGRGIAERFAAEGARVSILDLNAEGARAVAGEIGSAAMSVACDVSKGDEVEAAVKATEEAFGGLDVVINNAGWTNRNAPLMETDEATIRKIYDVNVMSIFHMTKSVVPRFRASGGGSMLNVGSTAGIRPRPGLTWYNSSKGAANLMTQSLAVELAPDRIRVNGIAPVMGRDGAPGGVHGDAGHAREPREVHRHDPAGPAVGGDRHRGGGGVPGLRRGGVPDGGDPARGRRPDGLRPDAARQARVALPRREVGEGPEALDHAARRAAPVTTGPSRGSRGDARRA